LLCGLLVLSTLLRLRLLLRLGASWLLTLLRMRLSLRLLSTLALLSPLLRLLRGRLGALLLLWPTLLLPFRLALPLVTLVLLSINLDNRSGKRNQGEQARNSKNFHIGPPTAS
jgi:hypothetical protein